MGKELPKNNYIYFDYAATTPVDQRVLLAMEPYWYKVYGNPSSLHLIGREAKVVLDDCRRLVADFLNAKERNVYFTAGGTESDNLALLGYLKHFDEPKRIVVSDIEHKAVVRVAEHLEREGWKVERCPVDLNGLIDEEQLEKLIDEDTVLVSIIYANNEIGVVQDIAKLSKIIKDKNAKTVFHTDACQATNFLNMNVEDLGVDLLSFSASKIYGPKGVGVLYANDNLKLGPMIWGGGQEKGMRSGTENVPGIVGMCEAIKIVEKIKDAENRRLFLLREKLISGILNTIDGVHINGDRKKCLPNIVNISVEGVEGESMVLYLDEAGFGVSTGSACSVLDLKPSSVLLALGMSEELAHCSLRISLGRYSSEEGVDIFLEIFPKIVERIRKFSAVKI